MSQPTREEISAIRKGESRPPSASTTFAGLLNKASDGGTVIPDRVEETPTSPAVPSEGPFAGLALDKETGAVIDPSKRPEPAEGKDFKEGSPVAPFIKELKAERDNLKNELATARKELEAAKQGGSQQEQAVAKEEYERLKMDFESTKTKATTYEQQIEAERTRAKDLEGKLAQISLDFDPDYQEKYIKPFENTQRSLFEMVDGLADDQSSADRIKGSILNALGAPSTAQFYAILKQVKDEDPSNYAMYLPQVTGMRNLLIDRITAQQNHEQTIQKLKTEGYSSRERTAPEAFKALDLARRKSPHRKQSWTNA
jgi:hypothetical protein